MKNLEEAIVAIDNKLLESGKEYLALQQASKLLVSLSIIDDTAQLKKALNKGEIPHAYQTTGSPKQWRIPLSESGLQRRKNAVRKKPKTHQDLSNVQPPVIVYPEYNDSNISSEKVKRGIFYTIVILLVAFCSFNPGCDSSNDNSSGELTEAQARSSVRVYLKSYCLRDPGSYRSVDWSSLKKKEIDGTYYINHTYRAKNGFGGYVVETKIFHLDSEGNVIEHW